MTAPEHPRARPRPFWGDARFLLGVLLVVVSVAGVWLVVSAARQTAPVLAASRTIVPGQTVGADDFRTVDVALGTARDAYVAADALPQGAVATRTISEGELLPAEAVGAAAEARVTTVVIDTAIDVPAGIAAGSRVEVWFAPALERGVFDTPRILVADATVASVTRDDDVIGQAGASLELVIPREDVAATLAAASDGSSLSVVPVAGRTP
jgi:hypothetical protein